MLILLIITVALIGLRLVGDNSQYFQLANASFASGLVGYSIGNIQWQIIVMLVLLVVGEGYAIASQFFTSLSLSSLLDNLISLVKKPAVPKK